MMMALLGWLLLLFVQTSWSYAGSQGLGLLAVLIALAKNSELRRRIWDKYRSPANTNPYLAGVIAGAILHHETDQSSDPAQFRGPAEAALAATGDLFFWRTLRPGLSVVAAAVGTLATALAPVVFLLPFLVTSQVFRVFGLVRGLARGRAAALEIATLLRAMNNWAAPFFAGCCGLLLVRVVGRGPVLPLVAVGLTAYFLSGIRWLAVWLLPLGLLGLAFAGVLA